jgi:hypothetical protein
MSITLIGMNVVSTAECPGCGAKIVIGKPECEYCGTALLWSNAVHQAMQINPEFPCVFTGSMQHLTEPVPLTLGGYVWEGDVEQD